MDFVIDLKDLNPATRFYADPEKTDDKKDGWIDIRLCMGDALEKINDKWCVKTRRVLKPEKKGGGIDKRAEAQIFESFEPKNEKDEKARTRDILDYSIPDYQLFDPKGARIPVDRKTKISIVENHKGVAALVAYAIELLTEEATAAREAETKN